MGFGSYDESEQKDQESDFDEEDAVNVHENSHEGEISFDSDASQDELLDQLNDIKNSGEEE
ncbi:DUF5786 family protein (plasmid) [Halorussus limi]|uniref:DUF5786 family protein n=1 Tax=Halorussus limi TaxID=2938695 RepID=A0A8U0HZT2_9EURY|nr:DUF5786 family protein [Halorussus limi]UPV76399.1 DUF5786 family protein [Halorussus limi]